MLHSGKFCPWQIYFRDQKICSSSNSFLSLWLKAPQWIQNILSTCVLCNVHKAAKWEKKVLNGVQEKIFWSQHYYRGHHTYKKKLSPVKPLLTNETPLLLSRNMHPLDVHTFCHMRLWVNKLFSGTSCCFQKFNISSL